MASITPSFDTLKSAILANARQYGICEGYHEVLRTTDYQSFIDAGIPLLLYAYKSFIVTYDLLSRFDEALLNANGIYISGVNTIDNPEKEIFVLASAELTINIDNEGHHNVNVLGTAKAHINMSGNSWCKLKAYQNSVADMTLSTTAAGCIETYQNSSVIVTQNNESTTDITATGDSIIQVTANDSAYALVQGFSESTIATGGAGNFNIKLYELSKIPVAI